MHDDPRYFSEAIRLRNGAPAIVRAIRPDDRERLQAAFLALEPESVYLRYFSYKHELSEADLECGTHAPRLQGTIEELARAGKMPTAAFNNCSGKHSGFLTTAVQYGEPTKDYIKYDHPVQRRLRPTQPAE